MSKPPMFYRPDATPIDNGDLEADTREWARLRDEHSRVAETVVGDWYVSTVYLGINHSFGMGPPLIYETMIFPYQGDGVEYHDEYQERYTTRQQALKGHQEAIKWAQRHPRLQSTP